MYAIRSYYDLHGGNLHHRRRASESAALTRQLAHHRVDPRLHRPTGDRLRIRHDRERDAPTVGALDEPRQRVNPRDTAGLGLDPSGEGAEQTAPQGAALSRPRQAGEERTVAGMSGHVLQQLHEGRRSYQVRRRQPGAVVQRERRGSYNFV